MLEGGGRSDVIMRSKDAPFDRHGNLPRGNLRAVEASGGFWMVSESGVPTLFADDGMGGIEAVAYRVARTEYQKQMDFEQEVALLVDDLLPEATARAISAALGD
jgi:hypothetical protein